jgi:hypothetical protein
MSSHHFVKEGQEPALILTTGFSMDDIGPLLEWAPVVLAFPNAIQSVVLNGIHVDQVVLSLEESEAIYSERSFPVMVLPGPTVTLETRIQRAIDFLSDKGATNVNLWVDNMSEINSLITGIRATNINFGIIERAFSWSIIKNGKFRKWLPASSVVFYNGKHGPAIQNGTLSDGVITVTDDGFLTIRSDESFWIGEPRNTF